jgi:hypothetical protein
MAVDTGQYPMDAVNDHDEEEVVPGKWRSEAAEADSPLVFEFLKKERAMPSPRRLDYML